MSRSEPRAYAPLGAIVLRSPLFPLERHDAWSADLRAPAVLAEGGDLEAAVAVDRRRLREGILAFFAHPAADEALFLASPGFRESLAMLRGAPDTKQVRDLSTTAVRYLTRMATRSTPFGLCAGTSFGHVGDRARLRLPALEDYQRAVRLDSAYVVDVARALAEERALRAHLRYRPNDTLYASGGAMRYYETIGSDRTSAHAPSYHLVDVAASEHLERALACAADGETPARISAVLRDAYAVDEDEATSFVDALIDRQILVADLIPPVVGDEPLTELLARVAAIPGLDAVREVLREIQVGLRGLAGRPIGASLDEYRELAATAGRLDPGRPPPRFHVDLYKPATDLVLPGRVVDDVILAIEQLAGLGAFEDDLADFRSRYLARYGDEERPLAEVLDEESGVGFRPTGARASPVLEGLVLGRSDAVASAPVPPRMIAWLEEIWTSGRIECELGRELAEGLARGAADELPPQLSAIVRIEARDDAAVDAGDYRVLLTGVSGAPISKLLGRFAHDDADALRIAKASVAVEHELDEPCVHAEIVHLPAPSAGNVASRPPLRKAVIPILSTARAGDERILLSDLTVRVVGREVVLRSISRAQRVIPVMACAIDPRRSPVSAYAFLDAVGRTEYQRALNWSWPSAFDEVRFLPRVCSGRVVLARARWRIDRNDLDAWMSAAPHRQLAELERLRGRYRIPRRVVIKEGDRELLLDLCNSLCVDVLLRTLERAGRLYLLEAFGQGGTPVHDGRARYAHDIIIPLRSQRARRPRPAPCAVVVPPRASARACPPGSEWTYLRLFASPRGVDRLVTDVLPRLTSELEDVVDRWFFVRYAKGGFHLRLRLHARRSEDATELTACISAQASELMGRHDVWRVELGTYEREIERYGGPHAMSLVEEVFAADSVCAMEMARVLVPYGRSADERWHGAAVGVDRLLADFDVPLAARERLVAAQADALVRRLDVSHAHRRRMDARYRDARPLLDAALDANAPTMGAHRALLTARSHRVVAVAGQLLDLERRGRLVGDVTSILGALVHMHINRMMLGSPLAHELVICRFLAKHYRSLIARADRRNTSVDDCGAVARSSSRFDSVGDIATLPEACERHRRRR